MTTSCHIEKVNARIEIKLSCELADTQDMTPETLDLIFPFIVFGYGILVLGALHVVPSFAKNLPPAWQAEANRLIKQRPLALVCLWVGGVWSLQILFL